tara:strand:+ start:170 stop:319 length:150 start_codon:yes stop_codon:yes gene_type:complete
LAFDDIITNLFKNGKKVKNNELKKYGGRTSILNLFLREIPTDITIYNLL